MIKNTVFISFVIRALWPLKPLSPLLFSRRMEGFSYFFKRADFCSVISNFSKILFVYLIFIISNHSISRNESKIFSSISTAFALISTIVLLINYFVQFSVVPISMIKGEKDGIPLITQYNDHGIFIAMEELGYITMSISFLFLGLIFTSKNRLERSIRFILFFQFLFTVLSFIYYSLKFGIDRSYRFEVATITINWLTVIIVGILISILIKNRLKIIK